MKILIRQLAVWLNLLCALAAGSEIDFSTLKTFSAIGKEEPILEVGKEVELLRREGKGCLTHMWFALDERVRIRVYVDGEKQPSIDMALDAYEKTIAALDLKDHRFRLEHCALMRKDQVERAMALDVLVSFFPNHIYYWGEAIRDNLFGPELAERYMPMGDAAEAGMRFSLHGDAPMTDSDPLGYVQLAVTRTTRSS